MLREPDKVTARMAYCPTQNNSSAKFRTPALFSIILFVAGIAIRNAEAQTNDKLSETEKWVMAELTKGEQADLTKRQPEKRIISARFLEQLLTKTYNSSGKIVSINGATINSTVSVSNQVIDCAVFLTHCEFRGGFYCDAATFNSQVFFSHSQFGPKSFRGKGAKFNDQAWFVGATFRGIMDNDSAEFRGGFDGSDAQFMSLANFPNVKGSGLTFFRAHFYSGADFRFAVLQLGIDVSHADFTDKLEDANFRSTKLGQLLLSEATFQGPAIFQTAEISGAIYANGTKFLDETRGADFSHVKIGTNFSLEETVFKGPAEFQAIEITGDLKATGVQFMGTSTPAANFGRAECKGDAVILVRSAAAEISLSYGTFGGLLITSQPGVVTPEIDLVGTTVHRQLMISHMSIEVFLGRFLHINESAELNNVKFKNEADLSNSKFDVLRVRDVSWPTEPNRLIMSAMTYGLFDAGDVGQSHSLLLELANKSKYSASVYTELATYLSLQGYSSDSNEAFIAGKRRERTQLPGWRPAWIGNLLLDWLIGYGRHPEKAGYVCLGIVALGCLLFSPKKMGCDPTELKKPDEIRSQYNRLWYSLGLFLPVVDLRTSEVWKPTKEYRFLRNYVRVHILLGWIFVPIFLAAVTGLIK